MPRIHSIYQEFLDLTTEAGGLAEKIAVSRESREDILSHLRAAQGVALAQELCARGETVNIHSGLFAVVDK